MPKETVGRFTNPHCLGNEATTKNAVSPDRREFPDDLASLIVEFMEQKVGIAPDPQRNHHLTYCLREKLLEWRRTPKNAKQELKAHLLDISRDRTQEIMGCVQAITEEAVQKERDERDRIIHTMVAKERKKMKDRGKRLIVELGEELEAKGADLESLGVDLSKYLAAFGTDEEESGEIQPTQVSTEEGPPVKRRKKEDNRRGWKEIPAIERKGFQKWGPEKKLAFAAEKADLHVGDYLDKGGSRNFVMRMNYIARCFVDCCNRDVAAFMAMHHNGRGNFSVEALTKHQEKMPGCDRCNQLAKLRW